MSEPNYKVAYYPNSGHSPAWPLVPRAMLALEESGHGFQPYVGPASTDPAMVALDQQGNALGFLIYRYDDLKCSWFIMLAYVREDHRRRGIHTAMFQALVNRAKARGDILAIDCGTHVNNVAAQAAFGAQGRAKSAIMYTYRLKGWVDGKEPTDLAQQ